MNTVQLECFLAVAEHLNFSKASRELKITQPAVSHQIQSLEAELNAALDGHGGGKAAVVQGAVSAGQDAIEAFCQAFPAGRPVKPV